MIMEIKEYIIFFSFAININYNMSFFSFCPFNRHVLITEKENNNILTTMEKYFNIYPIYPFTTGTSTVQLLAA